MLEIKDWSDPLERFQNEAQADVEGLGTQLYNYILYSKCDVLIPVAVGKVIYPSNVPFLRCKLIVPIANNTYSDNDAVSQKIWERGIVDVVENNVNWGGAAVAASELYGYDEDNVIAWCLEKAFGETTSLLSYSKEKGVPPWKILKERAEEEMFREHPIIAAARKYHFIGRMNKGFNEWIKAKWLPEISGVDADKYASYVAEFANQTLSANS